MCGLVAIVSKSQNGFLKTQSEMFHELLYVDNFRGDDSTGVFMVDRHGDLELIKEASCAPDFQRKNEYDVIMRNAFSRGRALVGHNRKATKGTITDQNAHPFVVDDKIILVHNGTLWGDYKKLAGEGNDVDVDSHAIAHVIHQKGDDVEAALKEINGAYALIWFDMEKQTLNFIRNSQRPLHFLDTGTEWVWASEKNMLDWMISRHNLRGTVAELKAGTLCSFKFNAYTVEVSNKELDLSTKSVYTGVGVASANDIWAGYEDHVGCSVNPLACGYDHPDVGRNDREALREALAAMERENDDPIIQPNPAAASAFEETSRAIVKAAQDSTRHKPRINAQMTSQHRADEEQTAALNHCHVTFVEHQKKVDQIADSSRVRVLAHEYQYLNLKDASDGLLLYGWLADDDAILVRIFMHPEEVKELIVLDWTVNKRDISALVVGKVFRTFDDKAFVSSHGDGFSMLYARDPARIMFSRPKEEKTNAV